MEVNGQKLDSIALLSPYCAQEADDGNRNTPR